MAHKQGLRFRILQVTMAVVRISSPLLLIHLASSFGFQRNRTSSRPGVMLPNKVPGPISRIGIARRVTTTTELLGGGNRNKRRSTDDRFDRNSRGDKFSRGDKDSSKRDRDNRPRGDTTKSSSDGGDRKRDRPSSSRDHQAASMTVASDDDKRSESDESSSSEGSN